MTIKNMVDVCMDKCGDHSAHAQAIEQHDRRLNAHGEQLDDAQLCERLVKRIDAYVFTPNGNTFWSQFQLTGLWK